MYDTFSGSCNFKVVVGWIGLEGLGSVSLILFLFRMGIMLRKF